MDSETRQPVAEALVSLLADGVAVTSVISDSAGRFTLAAPLPGRYQIGVERLGYGALLSASFLARTGDALTVRLELAQAAIPLAQIEIVHARPLDARLERWGLYDRATTRGRTGSRDGWFFEAHEIAEANAFHMRDLLRLVPGGQLRRGSDGMETHFRNGECRPVVYLNGARYRERLEDIAPSTLAAIEIYPRLHIDWSGAVVGYGCSVVLWGGIPATRSR